MPVGRFIAGAEVERNSMARPLQSLRKLADIALSVEDSFPFADGEEVRLAIQFRSVNGEPAWAQCGQRVFNKS